MHLLCAFNFWFTFQLLLLFVKLDPEPVDVATIQSSVVNATTLRITWQPPAVPNGIITQYTVEWGDIGPVTKAGLKTGPVTINNGSDIATDTKITLYDLGIYRRYAVKVAAWTSVGMGSFSQEFTKATTPAGGKRTGIFLFQWVSY